MTKKTCPHCQYQWYSRLIGKEPAECPSCKRYLNRPSKKSSTVEQKEGGKENG
jgi:hypothetical protein